MLVLVKCQKGGPLGGQTSCNGPSSEIVIILLGGGLSGDRLSESLSLARLAADSDGIMTKYLYGMVRMVKE